MYRTIIVILTICFIQPAIFADKKEKVIDISSVPANIQQVAKDKVNGISLICAKSVTSKKGTVYELKGVLKRKGYEIKINQQGKIVDYEISNRIPLRLSAIPAAVKSAAGKQVKNLVITEAELKMKGKTLYELEGNANGRKYDLIIDKNGNIEKLESEAEDSDGDDGDDDDDEDDEDGDDDNDDGDN